MRCSVLILLLATQILLLACKDDDGASSDDSVLTFGFENTTDSWVAGISDYPAEWEESRFEFVAESRSLPESVQDEGFGYFLSGNNLSDDLFMFIKREITGLIPNHTYSLTFDVELASQYPEESVGIGGSPGGSVYLKVGGSADEPAPVVKDGEIRMNIDKGNQSSGGMGMVPIGTIGIAGDEEVYKLIHRGNDGDPVRAQTDDLGNLWVIVGTDSGFEGVTAIYYNTISVKLEE